MKKNKVKKITVVEIIITVFIVIGLMILLFPIILKHINKSQMQSDMQTAKTIASAMTTILENEKIRANAVEHATPQLVSNMDGSDFRKAVYAELGTEEIIGKTKKDTDGEYLAVPEFYYTLNVNKNQIEIYYGGITEEYKIYPRTGSKLVK